MSFFGWHDTDPYERIQKERLAHHLSPLIQSHLQDKDMIVVLSCGTAYFEKQLLRENWCSKQIILVEDPLLCQDDYMRHQLQSVHPHAFIVEGSLDRLCAFFSELQHMNTISRTTCLGINLNIHEPFHLFRDILEPFQLDYLLLSCPYMGKSTKGTQRYCYITSNYLFSIPPISHGSHLSLPFVSPYDFFQHSGLLAEYEYFHSRANSIPKR